MKNSHPAKLISLNDYVKLQTDKRLNQLFANKILAAKKIDPNFTRLLEDMRKFVLRGGKRLRPTLMILGYQAANGDDINLALDTALALEVFHCFVLMHDDVMDGDSMRYGGLNMTGQYERRLSHKAGAQNAKKIAESTAIIAGDLCQAMSLEVIMDLKLPTPTKLALHQYLQTTLFETAAGQQLDILAPTRKAINLAVIEKINFYKTAQYSITSPLQFGVMAARGSQKLYDQFAKFGKELGVAFQLKDDLLGMFGSARQIGKPVGSDLREGKQTLLMYHAKKLANSTQWRVIESSLGKPVSPEKIRTIRTILRDCGAEAKVAVAASEYLQRSLQILQDIKLETEVRDLLISFAYYCVDRKK